MGEMKRLWAAVSILAALLAAALGTGWWVDGLTADYVSRLEQAQAVEEYLKLEEMDQYAAANAQLIAQLELLAEMEDPSLENVL